MRSERQWQTLRRPYRGFSPAEVLTQADLLQPARLYALLRLSPERPEIVDFYQPDTGLIACPTHDGGIRAAVEGK